MSTALPEMPIIAAIDAELASGFRCGLFQPDLEQRYEADTAALRSRHLFVASLIGLVLYDLFLVNDWTQARDIFWLAAVFRLGAFTPIAILGILTIKGEWPLKLQERVAGAVAVLSVALVMAIYGLTESPYRQMYQYGPMMIMVFVAVVQRIRIHYCVPTILGMAVIQALVSFYSMAVDAVTFQCIVTVNVTVSILVLFAAYRLEQERRRGYLLSIRSQLLNEQLDRYANIDSLTGLWNRRHLNAMMAAAWAAAAGAPHSVAVLLLDIDHFKLFNDSYGHLEGDLCLQKVGACIRTALEEHGDIIVRFGGEEFLILLPGADAANARDTAHRVLEAVRHEAMPHPVLGEGAIVTVSIGVAVGLAPQIAAAQIIRDADGALYEAKRAGRDRVRMAGVEGLAHDQPVTPGSMPQAA